MTTHAWPCLVYADARGAMVFLAKAFGFTPVVVHAAGDTVHHAELIWKDCGVAMIGSASSGGQAAGPAGSGSVYLVTESAQETDALYDRAVAAGARSVVLPHTTDYEARQFSVADPEGVFWSFGTYPGAG